MLETILTERHLALFGAIMQCFAHYELTIEHAIGGLLQSDRIAMLMRHLDLVGKCENLSEENMRNVCLVLSVVAGCLMFTSARAQQTNATSEDVQKGHYLTVLMCSSCHVIGPDQTIEPVLQPPAPSFISIAQRKTISPQEIQSFLATTHRGISNPAGMPNPDLTDFQMRQVEAYLLGLRNHLSAKPTVRQPSAAAAGSCHAEITRLESVLNKARASGQIVGTAPESTAARLHRQPTLQSVEQATNETQKSVETALAFGRKLEAEGLDAECAVMLQKVEPPSGPR